MTTNGPSASGDTPTDSAPGDAGTEGDANKAPFVPPKHVFQTFVRDFRNQKLGARTPRGPGGYSAADKAIVDGLDRRELKMGVFSVPLAIFLTVAQYFVFRHSTNLTYRQEAGEALIAGLVVSVVLVLGIGFKRRALLGFGAFFVGLEMLTFHSFFGIFYVAFGGWLITRVMRRNRVTQAEAKIKAASATTATRKPGTRPSASKRYTPPRRPRTATKGR